MTITGVVENGSIKLPPEVHLPDGTRAQIIFEPALLESTKESSEQIAKGSERRLHEHPQSSASATSGIPQQRSERGFPISKGRAEFGSKDVSDMEREADLQ